MEKGLKKSDSMALKGFAVLLMVFHHCYRTSKKFAGYNVIFAPFTAEQIVQAGLTAKICVSIFAFVSGYGLMFGYSRLSKDKNPHGVTGWIKGRLLSTLSGFWFFAPLAYVAYGLIYGFQFSAWAGDEGYGLLHKAAVILTDCAGLSELTGTKSLNGSWWYMGAAVVFILVFPLLAVCIEKYGGLMCAGLVFIFPRLLGIGFPGGTSALSFLMIFVLGMLCCKEDVFTKLEEMRLTESPRINEILKFLLCTLLLLLGLWSYRRLELKVFWEYQYALVPFLVIVFCVLYFFRIPPVKKVFCFLGKNSLYIWLSHTFVRDWLASYVWSARYFWLIPLVILGISLLVSITVSFLKKASGYDKKINAILMSMK